MILYRIKFITRDVDDDDAIGYRELWCQTEDAAKIAAIDNDAYLIEKVELAGPFTRRLMVDVLNRVSYIKAQTTIWERADHIDLRIADQRKTESIFNVDGE